MPQLTNTRWEMFCIGLASGKKQAVAYRDAGFIGKNGMGNASNASTLAKRPEIKARIAELIEDRTQFKAQFVATDLDHLGAVEAAVQNERVDKAWIIKELMENMKLAREALQFSASNQALKMLYDIHKEDSAADPDSATSAQKTAIPIAMVNDILASVGYEGAAIDLAKFMPPPVKVKAEDDDDNA